MKKDFLLVCNLKMNLLPSKLYRKALKNKYYENLIICPNFCNIKDYGRLKKKFGVKIGAQNVFEKQCGAYTGDISASMLKNVGAEFCIVGHSEQKKYHLETLAKINQKAKLLIEQEITPIICVGEEIKKDISYAKRYVKEELGLVLNGIDAKKVIVAYEPIWAIGTGDVPSSKHISEICTHIKSASNCPKVLYGGSFNKSNYTQIANAKGVDGALVGSASLDPDEIVEILDNI